MDLPIFVLLTQDGVTNGAVYALLALALVLVFTVTRVIFVPSGEFVAYGTLTLAGLQLGKPPATIGLLVGMAVVAGAMEVFAACAAAANVRRLPRRLAAWTGIPVALAGIAVVARHPRSAVLGADPRHADARDAARSAPVPDRLPAAGRGERARAADRLGGRAFRPHRARPVVLRRGRVAHAGLLVAPRSRSAASTSACRACSSSSRASR